MDPGLGTEYYLSISQPWIRVECFKCVHNLAFPCNPGFRAAARAQAAALDPERIPSEGINQMVAEYNEGSLETLSET